MTDPSLPENFEGTLADGDRELAAHLHERITGAVPEARVSTDGTLVKYEIVPGQLLAAMARRRDGFRVYLTPLYEHPDLVAGHLDRLKPLMVGKSCLRVRHRDEFPEAVIGEVLRRGAERHRRIASPDG